MPTSSTPFGDRPPFDWELHAARVQAEQFCQDRAAAMPNLVGMTAAEAEAKLDQVGRTLTSLERQLPIPVPMVRLGDESCLPSAPEQAPPLRARLWTRLRQAWCDHAAASAYRIPGFGPKPVFERRCGRCGATWTEVG